MAKLTKEDFISSLKEMNLLEIKELVDAMKEEFGVDPSAVAAAPAQGAGAAAAADGGLGNLGGVLIGGRQFNDLAHAQLSVLCLADVIQLIDGSLAAVPVQAQLVADLQKRVARFERILLGCVLLVCIGADGHASKQRGDHEHRQKHADESFLHDCVPPNLPFPGKNNYFLVEKNSRDFRYHYDSAIILQQVSTNCNT